MKHFLRLLMISFILLLLLGVSGNQDDQRAIAATESVSITLLVSPSGIIPEASTESTFPLLSRLILISDGPYSQIQAHEFITATNIRTRLLFFSERFLEYSPGIAEKKGILLILPAHEGDHSRA